MINRIVKMTFRSEEIGTFEDLFEKVKENIAKFEGCHSLQLLQDDHLPNVFFTYSIWEDEKALENYRNSDLFAETWKQTKALFDKKPEAWSTKTKYNSNINS